MKKINYVMIKFLMACWFILVFTFSSGLNAAEISRDAKRYMIRGQAAMEEAKTEADYQDAIAEFKKATQYAPEWADAWYNLGVVQEKAGVYQDAIESFNKYLELNPNAADSSDVEARTYKLEYKQDKQAKQEQSKTAKVEEQRRADKARIQRLSGMWREGINRYRVTVTGNAIEMVYNSAYIDGRWQVPLCPGPWIQGTVQGLTIQGSRTVDHSCMWQNGREVTHPLTGTISEDGNTILLKYTYLAPTGTTEGNASWATGWVEGKHDGEILTRE